MKCAWEQYYEWYQRAASQATVGRGDPRFMEEVMGRMIGEHGSVREVSDPPEILVACAKCRALITMFNTGRFELEGYCVEEGRDYDSLSALVKSKA